MIPGDIHILYLFFSNSGETHLIFLVVRPAKWPGLVVSWIHQNRSTKDIEGQPFWSKSFSIVQAAARVTQMLLTISQFESIFASLCDQVEHH